MRAGDGTYVAGGIAGLASSFARERFAEVAKRSGRCLLKPGLLLETELAALAAERRTSEDGADAP